MISQIIIVIIFIYAVEYCTSQMFYTNHLHLLLTVGRGHSPVWPQGGTLRLNKKSGCQPQFHQFHWMDWETSWTGGQKSFRMGVNYVQGWTELVSLSLCVGVFSLFFVVLFCSHAGIFIFHTVCGFLHQNWLNNNSTLHNTLKCTEIASISYWHRWKNIIHRLRAAHIHMHVAKTITWDIYIYMYTVLKNIYIT